MTKKIAIALIAVVLIALGVGLALPRSWEIERSIVIDATPERIAPFVLDLHRWQEWSVWTRAMDPAVRNTFEGPADGVGAKWLWLGPVMGRGRIEIVAADPKRGIELAQALESERVNSHGTIAFSTEGSATRVTWIDRGELPLLGGFFKSAFEERLGENLEKSLSKLKLVVD
ncbi:MAG: SRPBCC family protein, partial [Archangium sp.]